jgi:hypothetical protein
MFLFPVLQDYLLIGGFLSGWAGRPVSYAMDTGFPSSGADA